MNRSQSILLLCTVVLTAAFAASLLVADIVNPVDEIRTVGTITPRIHYVQSVSRDNGYYNICLAIPNNSANKSDVYRMVGNLGVNHVAQEDIPGLAMTVNGTALDASTPIRYDLKAGDTVQISMLVPCSLYKSGSIVDVIWWGSSQMWGEPVQLP